MLPQTFPHLFDHLPIKYQLKKPDIVIEKLFLVTIRL